MNNQPRQKVSQAEKEDEEGRWKENNMDFLADSADFQTGDSSDLLMLYRAAEGYLDQEQYKHVLNPYNSDEEDLQRYPAKMRNIDIVKPLINSFMGEMADRHFNTEVVVTNSDVVNQFKEELNGQMYALAAQDFVNQLNESGHNTGVPTEELPQYKAFVEEYKENWNDQRAIFGQEALNYINYNCDLKDKIQDAFYDWLVSGRCYSYKEPRDKDVHYEIVPPYELRHGHSPTNFIEDAPWAVRKFRRSPNAIVDMFRHELLPEDIDWLESLSGNGGSMRNVDSILSTTNIDAVDAINSRRAGSTYDSQLDLIDIYHGVWKTFREIGILTYIDELGKQQETEVDGTYKLDKSKGDISLVKEWINEVWQGYRIDRTIYLKIGAIDAQRNELNNSSKCKIPYNGRIGYNKHTSTGSMVRGILAYQATYNTYHFRRELTLARNKDKLMTMPIGLIPKDWSPEKALWFAETSSIMWFDETKQNAAQVLSAIKSIDMGLGTYVQQMTDLLASIKQEAWDSVGMNRQRYGDTKASDGKGVTEQAIARSSTISREMFRRFEKFTETDKQGLLDISKVAWIDGKKAMYVTSDGRKKFFEVNGTDHLESDYAVFARDSADEQAKLEAAKGLTNMMAQKGGVGASLMFETLDANNFAQLKKYAKKFEEIQQQLTEQAAKQEQDHQQQLQDKIDTKGQQDNQTKIEVAKIQAEALIQSSEIKSHTDIATTAMSNEASGNNEETKEEENPITKELLKAKSERDKLDLAANKNNTDASHKERDLNLKQQKIENDLKIAKANKNKYD